jgi:long-chain acyl-CoA synthetase
VSSRRLVVRSLPAKRAPIEHPVVPDRTAWVRYPPASPAPVAEHPRRRDPGVARLDRVLAGIFERIRQLHVDLARRSAYQPEGPMAAQFTNLIDLWSQSHRRYPDRPLFGTKRGDSWRWDTYADIAAGVDACRGGLARLGVGRGDAVGMIADNRPEWAIAAYATYGRGAAFVPMYEAQKLDEQVFILRDAACVVVFVATAKLYERLQAVRADLPGLRRVVGLDLPADHPDSFASFCATADAPAPEAPAATDVAGFIYTSGTTGQPKGVRLTHRNICSNINAIHSVFTFQPDDRSLSFLPWAHSFGQTCELHGLVSMGCSLAINDAVPNLLGNLATVQPTILFAVPRIFNRIYDGVHKQISERPGLVQGLFHRAIAAAAAPHRGESAGILDSLAHTIADRLIFSTVRARFGGRLKYCISGSAALAPEVATFIAALGINVYEGYGLTETSPIATANGPHGSKLGSVGRAIPEVRIMIDTAATGHAEHGEILIYGPNVMQGYHNRPEENAAVLMPDGGFRSGDMGYLDKEGFLFITGRIKEQYKLENGKYVVPTPLEEALKLSPYIANVMVHGANRPHNVALIVPDAEALRKWAADAQVALGVVSENPRVRALIAAEITQFGKAFKGYERPERFAIVDEDFTTDNGMLTPTLKLKRRAVLEKYGALLDALY